VLGFLAGLPVPLLVALCILYGVTVTGDSASITAGVVAASAPGERGATMAVHSFIGFSGAFLGPLVFGVVLDLTGGGGSVLSWGLAFLSSGLAVALGPLAIAILNRPPTPRGAG
jgi:MFS-type transporter involved in bile tolerance (Atg22 family)